MTSVLASGEFSIVDATFWLLPLRELLLMLIVKPTSELQWLSSVLLVLLATAGQSGVESGKNLASISCLGSSSVNSPPFVTEFTTNVNVLVAISTFIFFSSAPFVKLYLTV